MCQPRAADLASNPRGWLFLVGGRHGRRPSSPNWSYAERTKKRQSHIFPAFGADKNHGSRYPFTEKRRFATKQSKPQGGKHVERTMGFGYNQRPANAVLIFDWDDTICPSTFIEKFKVDSFRELPGYVSRQVTDPDEGANALSASGTEALGCTA